jgi:hypothetical protein
VRTWERETTVSNRLVGSGNGTCTRTIAPSTLGKTLLYCGLIDLFGWIESLRQSSYHDKEARLLLAKGAIFQVLLCLSLYIYCVMAIYLVIDTIWAAVLHGNSEAHMQMTSNSCLSDFITHSCVSNKRKWLIRNP